MHLITDYTAIPKGTYNNPAATTDTGSVITLSFD